MKISLVFDRLPELGPDPLDDTARVDRRLGEFFDTDDAIDVLLFVREYGDEFQDGSRTHVWQSGSWENVPSRRIKKILRLLRKL